MDLTQQPAQQGAEHAESFREAMFCAVRAQVQALPDGPEPIKCGLAASNDSELTEADVDAEVERIERERAEADSAYDKFKNSAAYDDARDARAYWSRNGRSYEDRPL